MFEIITYNWKLHRFLSKLARQRVGMVTDGDHRLIEYAVEKNNENRALMLTCQLRGWVEILHEGVPSVTLNSNGSIPSNILDDLKKENIWRLTDSGWAAIHRSHQVTILSVFLVILGLILSLAT